jgi:tetratricopeptide (TPR) repeat protein
VVQPDGTRPADGQRAAGWRGWTTAAAVTLLIVCGTGAYSNSFTGVFVFDDIGSITTNPHIKSLWPLDAAMSAPKDVTVAGRPIPALTLALNYALAPADARDGLTPPGPDSPPEDAERFLRNVWGYHAVNLLVHLLAGLALFGVVRRSLGAPVLRGRFGPSSTLIAWFVALIWIVHPLTTESVTYVVQRVESLMGLFYLLTLYCAIRATERGSSRRWWAAAAIVACALGMASKEAMVTAPLVVVLWDWLIGRPAADSATENPPSTAAQEPTRAGDTERWWRDRWSLYAGLAMTWVILAVLVAGNPRPHSAGFGLGGWTWWSSLQTQSGVVAHYLRLAVVPYPLVFDYGWPRAVSFLEVAPQALLLVALFAMTVIAVVRRRPLGFAGAWFFLILAPSSSILPIPTEVAAEHRMYLPVAAVITLTVAASWALGRRILSPAAQPGRPLRRVPAVAGLLAGVAVAATFGTMTYARNGDYQADERLMRDTVEKRPLNIRPRVAYGADLLAARRFSDAESQLREAARLDGPDKTRAQANMYLGAALCAQQKTGEGVARLREALSLDPTLAEAHALLGEAYAGRGELALAVTHFTSSLNGLPDNVAVLRRVAWLLATATDPGIRDGSRAVALAERAVRLTERRDVMALEALMAAYAEQDRYAEAGAAGREALALARAQGNNVLAGPIARETALCESGQKLREGR